MVKELAISGLQKFWLTARVELANAVWQKHKKNEPATVPVAEEDKCNTITKTREVVKRLYGKFVWTADSPVYLFDLMRTPAQCYGDFAKKGKLRDDCDGFHAAIYHALHDYYECYLITCMTTPVSKSHTMLIFKYKTLWYLVDYANVKSAGSTIEEVISFITAYRDVPVNCYNLVEFDYKEDVFKIKKGVK